MCRARLSRAARQIQGAIYKTMTITRRAFTHNPGQTKRSKAAKAKRTRLKVAVQEAPASLHSALEVSSDWMIEDPIPIRAPMRGPNASPRRPKGHNGWGRHANPVRSRTTEKTTGRTSISKSTLVPGEPTRNRSLALRINMVTIATTRFSRKSVTIVAFTVSTKYARECAALIAFSKVVMIYNERYAAGWECRFAGGGELGESGIFVFGGIWW
jgi:hypothetical protein